MATPKKGTPAKARPQQSTKKTAKAAPQQSVKVPTAKGTPKQSQDKVKKTKKEKDEEKWLNRRTPPPPLRERCHLEPSDFELRKRDFDRFTTSSGLNNMVQEYLPVRKRRGYGKIKLQKNKSGLQAACTRKLKAVDSVKEKSEGLKLLVKGVRDVMKQSWTMLIVYFDFVDSEPANEKMWSFKEFKKMDVVEILTNVDFEYGKACEEAAKDEDVELLTESLDLEMVAFVQDILELGKKTEREMICMKEWERHGTLKTLEARTLWSKESERAPECMAQDEDDDDQSPEPEDDGWMLHCARVL